MSARHHNEALCLVDAWFDGAVENDDSRYDSINDTGVMKRPQRDSYTQERPLLAASLELRPSIAADLLEPDALVADDSLSIHVRPTLRPTGS
jgi:hypothetical protein